MKKSDIYEVVIKIFGLYLFFTAVELFRDVLITISMLPDLRWESDPLNAFDPTPFIILSIVHFLFVILIASFLTFKTKAVVKMVCRQTDYEENLNMSLDRRSIYEISIIVIGFLLILWTIPDFVWRLKNYVQNIQNDILLKDYDTNFIVTSAIKIIVGTVAIKYSKLFSRFLARDNKNP